MIAVQSSSEVLDAHGAGEARRRRLDLGEQGGRIGRVVLHETAGATDHLARLPDRVVRAVGVALVVAVAECEQGVAVAGLGLGERRRERRPLGLAVHRLDGRRLEHHLVDAATVGSGERVGVEAVEQGVPPGADVDGVERAVVALLAPRRPVVERVLEADELRRPLVELAVTARLERRVEHHRPHPLREQPGVDASEVGAVADADVGDLLVADGGADRVHVAGGVGGGVEAQRAVVLRLARRAELVVDVVEGLRLLGRVGGVVEVDGGVDGGVVDAFDTARALYAARVEADEVVLPLQPELAVDRRRRIGREVVARPAGAARVEQDRPLSVALRRQPDQSEIDRADLGVGVVERDGERGALQVGIGLVGARAPRQRARLGRRLRRRRRRSCCRRRHGTAAEHQHRTRHCRPRCASHRAEATERVSPRCSRHQPGVSAPATSGSRVSSGSSAWRRASR